MKVYNNKRGQAVLELVIFGALILFAFGYLLSYLQSLNNQQYSQMESFRRALQIAYSYNPSSGGAGASVQFNLSQTRHNADLSGYYMKGTPQTSGAFSTVLWAVPPVGEQAETLYVYRVNEDQYQANQSQFGITAAPYGQPAGPMDQTNVYLSLANPATTSTSTFNDSINKQENTTEIVNTDTSQLQETINTNIPYTVRRQPSDAEANAPGYNSENDAIISQGTFWSPTQGLYRDASDGQYKYAQSAVGTTVERGKTWVTPF